MKRNVYLIDLGTGSDRNLLPLGVGLISSYAQSVPEIAAAYDVHIRFLRDDTARMVESLDDPAVVGIALYVWNKNASLKLATAIRERYPEALIVVGGYSVPKDPNRIARFLAEVPQVNVLVHGEGEFTFAELLKALARGEGFDRVEGISYRGESGPVTTPRRARVGDLDDIPSPFLDGTFDALMESHGDRVTGVVWETNRGCPFSCTFCDWGQADVNKLKRFDLDRLKAELEWISRNGLFYIYLADANFGILRDRDLEIAETIAQYGKANGHPGFVAVNWTKNSDERIIALAETFARGGVETSVTLAMQSFNEDTLAAIKRKNISLDSLMRLKRAYHDRDLPTYTELILGLPEETYDSFVAGLNRAMTARLADHWVCHLCTLLENTEMESDADRARYAIESRVCAAGISRRAFSAEPDEEFEELVVGTAAMPNADWRRAYAVSYLSAALYNFRAAFFVMNFLREQCGGDLTDIVEFVIDDVGANRETYPVLRRAVEHVERQRDAILDNIACLSSVAELGGRMALPHEALLAILLDDADGFARDLGVVAERFLADRGVPAEPQIVGEVVRYQIARLPSWEARANFTLEFETSVPAYFEAITAGEAPEPIRRALSRIEVLVRESKAADKATFAAQRTRSGHTIHINRVRMLPGGVEAGAPRSVAAAT